MANFRNATWESQAKMTSYTDTSGAAMDYDSTADANSTGGYAQFGAKASGGGSIGTKIRTILAGVVKDAIAIASSGLLVTLLAGSTLAAQAVTATTLHATGAVTVDGSSFLQDMTATMGVFSGPVSVIAASKTLELSTTTGAGALVAGGWVTGVAEGLSLTPNNDGVAGKSLVLGYFDGFVYRSAIDYASTTGGALTTVTVTPTTNFSNNVGIVGTLSAAGTTVSTMSATGTVGIGAAAGANVGLLMQTSGLPGTVQIGAEIRPVFSSSCTAVGRNIDVLVATAAAAFTLPNAYGLYINTPSVGAGSAITNVYGIYLENQTGAGTLNYALFSAGGRVNLSLPTTSAGLASGDLWNSAGVVHVA